MVMVIAWSCLQVITFFKDCEKCALALAGGQTEEVPLSENDPLVLS